jgi:8-oxo-dGTP pyrophosphatase MutT (NUDIX family)
VNESVKPRQAATVILLRETAPNGFEVFLTRRPNGMQFLGGMYCFPGGAVTKEDCAPRIMELCHGLTPEQARKIAGAGFRPRQAMGFWIAAARELYEEVGILLAVNSSGMRVSPSALSDNRDLAEMAGSFVRLLRSESLYCDLSRLIYFSHWQTPAQNTVRFDTRFFVAVLPPDQTPLETSAEVTHSLWLTPELAMQAYTRGELPMIFPTFTSLRTLADFTSVESVIKEFGRHPRSSSPPA